MLLPTVQNKMVQDRISLSLVKVKVKFKTKRRMWKSLKGKNWAPPGRLRSLSSIILVAPPCWIKTPPWPSPPEPADQGCPGYTSLQEQWLPPSCLRILDLVVAARIEDTSSLVNKTVSMLTLPLIRLAMLVMAHLVYRTVKMTTSLPHRAGHR